MLSCNAVLSLKSGATVFSGLEARARTVSPSCIRLSGLLYRYIPFQSSACVYSCIKITVKYALTGKRTLHCLLAVVKHAVSATARVPVSHVRVLSTQQTGTPYSTP